MMAKSFPFSSQLICDVRGKRSGFTKRTYCCIMITRGVFFFVIFFNVVHFNVFINAEVCEETENGIIFRDPLKGRRLENNLIKTVSTLSIVECSLECLQEMCCLSVNYGKDLNNMKEHDCELNEGKLSTNPEDFTKNGSYLYYEIIDTGNGCRAEPCSKALGNSKDLPGKSCDDIKQHTNTCISKEYWIKPTDTAIPFLVFCEMKLYEGGWTLVYSYTFTNYTHFYVSSNAVVPRPDWNAPNASVTISKKAPLKHQHDAIDYQYWESIGRNFFIIRSNINNWYKCKPGSGSLVQKTDGNIICENLVDIGVACNETIKPEKIRWEKSGPVLKGPQRSIYRFDGSTTAFYPVHNSCKSSTKNHKRGVTNPYGKIFIK